MFSGFVIPNYISVKDYMVSHSERKTLIEVVLRTKFAKNIWT
jgi:hypothetical protein